MLRNLCFLFIILFGIACQTPEKQLSLENYIKTLEGVSIISQTSDSAYHQIFELKISQPIDHFGTPTDSFQQYVVLKHRNRQRSVVYETEGYILSHRFKPLADSLEANQLIVEHRYEGQSKPDSMVWKQLTIKQAAADFHRIALLFKPFYKKNWVSAGFSKGGQTAMYYRRFYPNDVKATVCFDAPLNFEQQEKRIDAFFDSVGTPECRQKLIDIQRSILGNRKTMLSLLEKYCEREKVSYKESGLNGLLEYAVLEYPFSFWQYSGLSCEEISMESVSSGELFHHLVEVVGFDWLSDSGYNSAAMYQFHTELGYYGYVTKYLADLLQVAPLDANNLQFAAQFSEIQFDSLPMQDINQWIQTEGNNMIFIYGDDDPWAATRVELTGKTNALKIVKKGGNHLTMLHNLKEKDRKKVMETLRKWME